MKSNCLLKYRILIVIKIITISFFIVFAGSNSLFAESVFLKNGEIHSGKITDLPKSRSILLKKTSEEKTILRSDILRIAMTDDYKHKRYFYAKDGSVIQGYLVAETFDSYTYRLKLNSSKEYIIKRNNLYFVTLKQIYLEKDKKMPSINPPLVSTQNHAVFLKDGKIIEGTIVKDKKDQVIIKDKIGKKRIFDRKKILRVMYNDTYRYPFYLYKFNNFYDRAFIVGEDRKNYYLRDNLKDSSEREESKSDYNFVSFSKIPLDKTKYAYPDINIMTMYVPSSDGDKMRHVAILGVEFVDPVEFSFMPYWVHWTVGSLVNLGVGDNMQVGIAANTGILIDVWRFVYTRLEVGNIVSFGDSIEVQVFTLTGVGVKYTFDDSFFIGLEAGVIVAKGYYSQNEEEVIPLQVMPSLYLTFGFNIF